LALASANILISASCPKPLLAMRAPRGEKHSHTAAAARTQGFSVRRASVAALKRGSGGPAPIPFREFLFTPSGQDHRSRCGGVLEQAAANAAQAGGRGVPTE
jgi:hypothetical protein